MMPWGMRGPAPKNPGLMKVRMDFSPQNDEEFWYRIVLGGYSTSKAHEFIWYIGIFPGYFGRE